MSDLSGFVTYRRPWIAVDVRHYAVTFSGPGCSEDGDLKIGVYLEDGESCAHVLGDWPEGTDKIQLEKDLDAAIRGIFARHFCKGKEDGDGRSVQ